MRDRLKAQLTILLVLIVSLSVGAWLVGVVLPEYSQKELSRQSAQTKTEAEVLEIIKNCNVPATDWDVLHVSIGHLERAKLQGNLIEFEGWYAFPIRDSLYEAGFGYKMNGIRKTARWDVDLSNRTIRPRNQEAFILTGNNDLLQY